MKRLIAYAVMAFGSAIGWWLGKQIGFFAAFIFSVFGAGIGMYLGRRLVRDYLE